MSHTLRGDSGSNTMDRAVESCAGDPDPVLALIAFQRRYSRATELQQLSGTVKHWTGKVGQLTRKLKKYRGATANCAAAIELRNELKTAQVEVRQRTARLNRMTQN